MPKKKVQFPKRDKQLKMTALIGGVSAAVIIIAVSLTMFIVQSGRSWVFEYNGTRYAAAEMEFFARPIKFWYQNEWQTEAMWEGTPLDKSAEVKDFALEEMLRAIAVMELAKENGITLPQHLADEARMEAESYRSDYRAAFGRNPRLSEARLTELFSSQFMLDVLLEELGYRAELDMDEFYEYWDEYVELDKWNYLDIYLTPFVANSLAEASQFLTELATGADFHELLEKFTHVEDEVEDGLDENGENGDENGLGYEDEDEPAGPMLFMDFVGLFGLQSIDEARAIGQLNVGEYSAILESAHGNFGIVLIERIDPAEGSARDEKLAETKAEWLEDFTMSAQQQYISDILADYMDEMVFKLNQRGINAVRIGRL